MRELGLFPLPLVLLPGERVPLHIFEERYKELIEECISARTDFGLVYADDDGLRDVGTCAEITQVLTRFPDGRLNILVEGSERFRIVELTAGRPYQSARVAPVPDDEEAADPASTDRALELFTELRDLTESDVDIPDRGAEQLSFVLAGRVELPAEDKLELLRDDSERRRMERICELFGAALERARHIRTAGERAALNGRVQLG